MSDNVSRQQTSTNTSTNTSANTSANTATNISANTSANTVTDITQTSDAPPPENTEHNLLILRRELVQELVTTELEYIHDLKALLQVSIILAMSYNFIRLCFDLI